MGMDRKLRCTGKRAPYLRRVLGEFSDTRMPEVVRIGSHKTAGDRFTRGDMSPEEREQLETLADDLFDELVERINPHEPQ